MSIELKIKSKHLALEPQIIRHEERKLKQRMRYHRSKDGTSSIDLEWKLHSLTNHRKFIVRHEARATHLARAYLAGKAYKSVEQSRKKCNEMLFLVSILKRVHAMVIRYGNKEQRTVTYDVLKEWCAIPYKELR